MNALPNNVVAFELPKKPKIKQKDAPPDQRKVCVLPIRAITDQAITDNMLRVLAVLCSYCNRAGLTWVSQKKLSEDMKVSQQAISKQLVKLTNAGYVEIVRKGFRGERSNTVRVIFDITVDTATAIAVTNPIEDTRPPAIKQEQDMIEQEEIDRAGQARIAKLIAQGLKSNQPRKEPHMANQNDSLTVKKMKAEIAKKSKPKGTPLTTPEVVNGTVQEVVNEGSHTQPYTQPNEVVENTKNTVLGEVYKGNSLKEELIKEKSIWTVLCNSEVEELKSNGLTDTDITEGLDILTAAYKAEGLTPKSSQLVSGLLQMHRDAK
jgi:predicted transcriptional regulator